MLLKVLATVYSWIPTHLDVCVGVCMCVWVLGGCGCVLQPPSFLPFPFLHLSLLTTAHVREMPVKFEDVASSAQSKKPFFSRARSISSPNVYQDTVGGKGQKAERGE